MKQDNGEFNCLLPRPESAAVNDWIINNGGLAVVVALDLVLSACDYRLRDRAAPLDHRCRSVKLIAARYVCYVITRSPNG